ncbi:hypothetical protein MSG28_012255 [Choristoneura fumiferana]|uniref:Uncharacterized protein n=1 Tax=Choristoneura fumiferana TaxID=7141 RepID=A0ACC0KCD1_CHOFU|nr:hypothetical protein MSG28_012255 [Choristoneura fumiferana]
MDTTLIAVDIKADDFSKACTNGIFLVVWVVVTFQYGVVLTFKDQLKTLIRINQENFDAAESMPEEDQALIREYAYRARWVTKVWCFSCCLNCALFPIKSLVLTLYSLYIDDFRLVPWYDCSFPSVIEEINYVQLINDVFKVLYEISLKASAIMLPITLYQVIDSFKRHELCMEYMAFILTASLLCYVPCYYSDLLMEKNWYIYRADIGYQRACSSALTLYPGSSFDIVPVDSNFKNKSPVLHVENCLGLESWCVKHVYMYCYSELMDKCFVKPKRKTPKSSVNSERLAQLLNVTLLLNPELNTFWNKRRELLLRYENLQTRDIETLISEELHICQLSSDKSPNNYHSWNHRMWLAVRLRGAGLVAGRQSDTGPRATGARVRTMAPRGGRLTIVDRLALCQETPRLHNNLCASPCQSSVDLFLDLVKDMKVKAYLIEYLP